MDFPAKKDNDQIKAWWTERAEEMKLSQAEANSNAFDMVQMLAAAQQTYGPSFWNNPKQYEDIIHECLTRENH